MAKVVGLGHLGIYVRDLERMVAFYRDFMGMQLTKQDWAMGMVFFSSDPAQVDHEIALVRGRPEGEDPHLINQISFRVETLAELRTYYQRIKEAGFRIRRVVTHASAIGCYFDDPEGNITEVFWLTGRTCWCVVSEPIDLEQPDDVVLARVDEVWERLRHVPVGGMLETAAPRQ